MLSLVTRSDPDGTWYATEPYLAGGMVGEPDPGSKLTWNANPNQDFGGPVGVMNPFSVGPVADSRGNPATDNSALTISCRSVHRGSADRGGCVQPIDSGTALGRDPHLESPCPDLHLWLFRIPGVLPPGRSRHVARAVVLLRLRRANADDRAAAEIDLLEIFGPARGTPWFSSLHQLQSGGTPVPGFNGSVNGFYRGDHDTSEWHAYGLDWQEDALTFYLDRERIARQKGADAAFYRGVKMAIRMNYTMTEEGAGPDSGPEDESTPDPLTMSVDYVRMWPSFDASVDRSRSW